MWSLLKTQWTLKKYPILMTLVCPGAWFFYRNIQSIDKWTTAPWINTIVGMLVAFTVAFTTMDFIYRQISKERNPLYVLIRLPIAFWKIHTIRLLSGPALFGSLITIIPVTVLFLTRERFGSLYVTLLAFHGLLLSTQILALITEDVIYKWFKVDGEGEGFCIILVPTIFIFAILDPIKRTTE